MVQLGGSRDVTPTAGMYDIWAAITILADAICIGGEAVLGGKAKPSGEGIIDTLSLASNQFPICVVFPAFGPFRIAMASPSAQPTFQISFRSKPSSPPAGVTSHGMTGIYFLVFAMALVQMWERYSSWIKTTFTSDVER